MREQVFFWNLVVAANHDAVHFMFLALVNVVNHKNLIGFAVDSGLDVRVIEPFLFEIIRKVLLAFLHQVRIETSLGIDWNQLLSLPP